MPERAAFTMQERDLDLFVLEELHSDSGLDRWFGERLGLPGFRCREAEHSKSAKSNAKWGETDVFALFGNDVETVAVLIEDKIAAEFTERQAARYHERARDIVASGQANRYITVLLAPSIYLRAVPKDDPWHERIEMEALRDWFAGFDTSHALWRRAALTACLERVARSERAGSEEVQRASREFDAFLRSQLPGSLTHRPTSEKWFIIATPLTPLMSSSPGNLQSVAST